MGAKQLVKDKPVASTGLVATVAAGVEAYAESRGWIPAAAAPYVAGATVALLAWVAHELVAPYAKVKRIVEDGLHLTDADYGRAEVMVEHLIVPAIQARLGTKADADPDAPGPHPSTVAIQEAAAQQNVAPEAVIPGGMNAGAVPPAG